MHITNDEMNTFPLQPFRKTALLHVRPLTEDDYKERHGIIQTREGSASFQPGDVPFSWDTRRGMADHERALCYELRTSQ